MNQEPAKIDNAKRGRNIAIALGVASLMALFFAITVVKFAMA